MLKNATYERGNLILFLNNNFKLPLFIAELL